MPIRLHMRQPQVLNAYYMNVYQISMKSLIEFLIPFTKEILTLM